MTIPIRNVGELRALRKRLVELHGIGRTVAARLAPQFSALARRDFDARRSPNGTPWKPSKKSGKTPTLHRLGVLEQAAAAFVAVGNAVRVSVMGVRYARYQNPSRFIPSNKKLSPERAAIVETVAEEEIARALGSAA